MGITPSLFSMLQTTVALTGAKRIIELGNQHFHTNDARMDSHCGTHVAKRWAESLGIEHVSIDTNGLDGALALDLSKPIYGVEPADIVTNFGTSEHVGIEGQDQCFANIRDLCKPGGVMLHAIPLVGYWPGHSDVDYDGDFFDHDWPGCTTLASWIDTACGADRHLLCGIVRRDE